MTQSKLDRLNVQVDVLYRAHKGENPTSIAKGMGVPRQRVYRILQQAERNHQVVKSVEKRIANEMREEDKAYGL
jgi:hypothetical protein